MAPPRTRSVPRGVVAAGHPVTAEAGAELLRAGGNAVDAALAAMFASFVAEPLLTGLGAGGYMLVAPPGEEPVLLDFFVAAAGRGRAAGAPHAPLETIEVDFGDAVQLFHIGASAAGPYGTVAGACAAAERYARLSLAELVVPAVAHARAGVEVNRQQAYLFEILEPICAASPAARELYMPAGRPPVVGDVHRDPILAGALERLAAEGAAPFYTGEVAAAVCAHVAERGGLLTPADLAAYEAVPRTPVRVCLPRPDRADQPAAERRRHADRPRARAARAGAVAAVGAATSSARWRRPRRSGRPSSSPGSARRRTSPRWTGRAGRAR